MNSWTNTLLWILVGGGASASSQQCSFLPHGGEEIQYSFDESHASVTYGATGNMTPSQVFDMLLKRNKGKCLFFHQNVLKQKNLY